MSKGDSDKYTKQMTLLFIFCSLVQEKHELTRQASDEQRSIRWAEETQTSTQSRWPCCLNVAVWYKRGSYYKRGPYDKRESYDKRERESPMTTENPISSCIWYASLAIGSSLVQNCNILTARSLGPCLVVGAFSCHKIISCHRICPCHGFLSS